jgi:membrane-associated phospholipid phosphatase
MKGRGTVKNQIPPHQPLAEQEETVHNSTADGASSAVARDRSMNRRTFLGNLTGATAAAMAASAAGLPPLPDMSATIAEAEEIGPSSAKKRRKRAYSLRKTCARLQRAAPRPVHPTNTDDEQYSTRIGSFTKALPHNNFGEVDAAAYTALLTALESGKPNDFAVIPLGGAVKLANPQAAYAFALEGADSHHLEIPAAPAFASAEEAAEMAEVYWQALTRDVPFVEYETSSLINQATADLSAFSMFSGPKDGNTVTSETLFRGNTMGDLTGPYLSQFLWKDIPYGAQSIVQQYRVPIAGNDHLTSYTEWLKVQNGMPPTSVISFDPTPRYLRNGRDLGEYVHRDFTYQAFLNAALILLSLGGAALDDNNPYKTSTTQSGFSTFGGPAILDLVARVANAALQAAWYQKWLVHRRLRPEEFGGRVHNHKMDAATYPIHSELLNSPVLDTVFNPHGTYLLPIAYPEGCPIHPAYPAGHATIAGACTTILKAFFKESFVLANPVEASADGLSLLPYTGASLTVGGELNKLAANIALGRDTVGVHWRSDGMEGIKLGEAVAIGVLKDFSLTYNEVSAGFSLTRFDDTTITVG